MKISNHRIMGAFYCVIGLAVALLPSQLVCPWTPEHGFMRCWDTAQAMTLIGGILAVAGMVMFLFKQLAVKIAVHSISLLTQLTGILIPAKIIGGCMVPTMRCHTIGFPFIYCTLAVAAVFSAWNLYIATRTWHQTAQAAKAPADRRH